jgi:hypothetical protein
MYLPESISSAKLYIYNMQGGQVKSFDVISRGNTSVTIEGFDQYFPDYPGSVFNRVNP